jgi:hypothetical protein
MVKFWGKEQSNTVEEEEPAKTSTEEKEPVATNEEPVTANKKEPEEQLVHDRFPRMHAWVALTVSSIICLCSIANWRTDAVGELWVLIVSCVSLTVSFLTSVVYCFPRFADKFVDKIYEGIVAFLVLVFWIGRLSQTSKRTTSPPLMFQTTHTQPHVD